MTLHDLIYGAWAITPGLLREIRDRYEAHVAGERLSAEELEQRVQARYGALMQARAGSPSLVQAREFQVVGGVAVISLAGVMSPKANLMTEMCGGLSMQQALATLQAAARDSRVQSILQVVDTPGGNVVGPPEYALAAFEISKTKPIVTLSDNLMASGGVWVGTAANQVYISGPTVNVGSIGVCAVHRDTSARDKASGTVETEITAGKYKRITSGSLTAEARDYLQQQVDHIYGVFVDHVAQFRGTDAATVLADMADGRMFIGQQAIDAGLVDGVATFEQLLSEMQRDPGQFASRPAGAKGGKGSKRSKAVAVAPGASVQAADSVSTEGKDTAMSGADTSTAAAPVITRDALERDHSALFAALKTELVSLGATQERERIVGVRATVLPGHEALVETLAFDGKTTPAEAALAVNQAERQVLSAQATAHANDAPPAQAASANAGTEEVLDKQAQVAKAQAHAKEKGIGLVAALKELGFAA
jgi:capsid assembly protease